jgi:hypothetical protein
MWFGFCGDKNEWCPRKLVGVCFPAGLDENAIG